MKSEKDMSVQIITELKEHEKAEILEAQAEWGQFIVDLGQLDSDGSAKELIISEGITGLKALYAFEFAPVVFKPTKSSSFRPEPQGALSYFIGNRDQEGFVSGDHGFATGGHFTAVRFDNQVWQKTSENVITVGGHYYFVGADGNETKADFTFSYVKLEDGGWYIATHHSSLPYSVQSSH